VEKTFKTLDEQVGILQNKGLIIDDVDQVKEILLRENYFFINGYRHLFLSENERVFISGTNFRELYAMFNFDRQIRNIIFKNVLIVENNMKSIFSYQLSKMYGYRETSYLSPSNFDTNPSKIAQINDLLKKMKRQIRVNSNRHSATIHYEMNYGYIPMWIAVKVLSFGVVSELFTVMKKTDQIEIGKQFNTSAEDLIVFLPILANFRNLCAHEDILYSYKTQRYIPNTKYHKQLEIPKEDGEYIYGRNDLFALIIILKHILLPADFSMFIKEITYEMEILEGKLKTINIAKVLEATGIPENFKEIVRLN